MAKPKVDPTTQSLASSVIKVYRGVQLSHCAIGLSAGKNLGSQEECHLRLDSHEIVSPPLPKLKPEDLAHRFFLLRKTEDLLFMPLSKVHSCISKPPDSFIPRSQIKF